MSSIRKATVDDASRIAEILIFNKRTNYRRIFNDDHGSFCELQVYPTAKKYMDNPETLENIWAYEDDFAKGMIHIEGDFIAELYVDTFFQNEHIGAKLIEFACEKNCKYLWVLEENVRAISFYKRHGFELTDEKKYEDGYDVLLVKMQRDS